MRTSRKMKAWGRKINVSRLCSSSSQKVVPEVLVRINAIPRSSKTSTLYKVKRVEKEGHGWSVEP